MELLTCVRDDDYEAWRSVRIAVLPRERCDTVAQMRAHEPPDQLRLRRAPRAARAPAPSTPPAAVDVVALSDQSDRWATSYETFGREVLSDFAH